MNRTKIFKHKRTVNSNLLKFIKLFKRPKATEIGFHLNIDVKTRNYLLKKNLTCNELKSKDSKRNLLTEKENNVGKVMYSNFYKQEITLYYFYV